jgi:hypothetical protein
MRRKSLAMACILDLRFCSIQENLDSLRQSIASSTWQDAMLYASQLNALTRQLVDDFAK